VSKEKEVERKEEEGNLSSPSQERQIAAIQAINEKITQQGWKPLRFVLPVENSPQGNPLRLGQFDGVFQEFTDKKEEKE
jgi:hypothetical protein